MNGRFLFFILTIQCSFYYCCNVTRQLCDIPTMEITACAKFCFVKLGPYPLGLCASDKTMWSLVRRQFLSMPPSAAVGTTSPPPTNLAAVQHWPEQQLSFPCLLLLGFRQRLCSKSKKLTCKAHIQCLNWIVVWWHPTKTDFFLSIFFYPNSPW